jgi:putative transport protein
MNFFVVLMLFFISSTLGVFIGKKKFGSFSLGKSSILFVALFLSYIAAINDFTFDINPQVLKISLIGFIGSVGLLASKEIKTIIKDHGLKFFVMAFSICGSGFILALFLSKIDPNLNQFFSGIYVGALTSSPGLASILEHVNDAQGAMIGTAYAIAYIPGVISVIGFTQLMASSNHDVERQMVEINERKKFNIIMFALIMIVGYYVGQIHLMGISLGVTGGILLSSLLLGNLNSKVEFDQSILEKIKTISLSVFLSYVGLKYGKEIASSIYDLGIMIMIYSFIVSLSSIGVGYVVGKYVLKLPQNILVGSICGGMTSTPGLASATEYFKGEKVVSAYGATYPFALILMIIFVNILA